VNSSDLIKAIQEMVAVVAIGPSALRGQGAPGVIAAAREYLAELDLRKFAVGRQDRFDDQLDVATDRLCSRFPRGAQNWGAARKGLNLFLRDSFYNRFLCQHFHLEVAEKFYEIPLDGIIARGLIKRDSAQQLPRWKGIKYLNRDTSGSYQSFALIVAQEYGISRVHLDTILWIQGRQD
jgi:hypothetical protein